MILADDVLLMLLDDASGKPVVDSTRLDLALAGAVLLDLTTLGRVDVARPGELVRAGRIVVRDTRPVDDVILDDALRRIAGMPPKKPESLLPALAKGLRHELLGRLAARGILRAEQGRVFGIFPTHTWPAVDSSHEQQVRAGLVEVLTGARLSTAREAELISLLHAVDQVPTALGDVGVGARELRERANALVDGGLVDTAVRHAVEAVNAAMVAAVLATTAATGAASA